MVRKMVAAGMFTLVTLAAAGCSSGPTTDAPTSAQASPTVTSTHSPATSAAPTSVDAADFERDGAYVFSFDTGSVGTCVARHDHVMCTGEPDLSAPDVTVEPFGAARPGAVVAHTEGVSYALMEGVPPAQKPLKAGEAFTLGDVACTAEAAKLTCVAKGGSFSIAGEQRRIETTGTVTASAPNGASISTAASTPAVASPSETAEPLATPGIMCGADRGTTVVQVEYGPITCTDAVAVMERYLSVAQTEGGGNTLLVSFPDGWNCSSPTAATAQELKASQVCENSNTRLLRPTG